MKKPIILMIHRVECNNLILDKYYYQRNMVIKYENLKIIIEKLLEAGYRFGSLEQAIATNNHFHLTFDDGYKEYLTVAKRLLNDYDVKQRFCSFAINVGNSLLSDYSGMDLLYNILKQNSEHKILYYFQDNHQINTIDINHLKDNYIKFNPEELRNIKSTLIFDKSYLKNQYLHKDEIIELSTYFKIISHGISHRNLRFHKDISKQEISESKKFLEQFCEYPIEVFCYPEGKNDQDLWRYCKDSGYKFGLSINHGINNPYNIGRYCVNRHLKKLWGDLNVK